MWPVTIVHSVDVEGIGQAKTVTVYFDKGHFERIIGK